MILAFASWMVGCSAIPASSVPGEGSRFAAVDARWCIGGATVEVEAWSVPYGVERIGGPWRTRFEGRRVLAATQRDIARGRLDSARLRLSRLPEDQHYAAAFGYAALGDSLFHDAATRVRACLDYDWAAAQVYSLGNAPLDPGLASYLEFMLAWCDVTLPPTEDRSRYRHDVRSGHILAFAAKLRGAARRMGSSRADAGLVGMFETSLEQVVEQIPDPVVRSCVRDRPRSATDPECAGLYVPTYDVGVLCGD